MSKTVSAINVAELFLSWANKDGEIITNLKMQKLLYYAQAWHLVNFNKALFEDEIEAWDLGPVVRSVYTKYKKNGPLPISYKDDGSEVNNFTDKQLKFLKEFYGVFIKFSAHVLVNMSHNESPWKTAYKSKDNIDTDLMKQFYIDQYNKSLKHA